VRWRPGGPEAPIRGQGRCAVPSAPVPGAAGRTEAADEETSAGPAPMTPAGSHAMPTASARNRTLPARQPQHRQPDMPSWRPQAGCADGSPPPGRASGSERGVHNFERRPLRATGSRGGAARVGRVGSGPTGQRPSGRAGRLCFAPSSASSVVVKRIPWTTPKRGSGLEVRDDGEVDELGGRVEDLRHWWPEPPGDPPGVVDPAPGRGPSPRTGRGTGPGADPSGRSWPTTAPDPSPVARQVAIGQPTSTGPLPGRASNVP
jgi:hypothetical protein